MLNIEKFLKSLNYYHVIKNVPVVRLVGPFVWEVQQWLCVQYFYIMLTLWWGVTGWIGQIHHHITTWLDFKVPCMLDKTNYTEKNKSNY